MFGIGSINILLLITTALAAVPVELCSQDRDTAELCGWIRMSSTARYITDPGPTQVRGLILDLDCTDELQLHTAHN